MFHFPPHFSFFPPHWIQDEIEPCIIFSSYLKTVQADRKHVRIQIITGYQVHSFGGSVACTSKMHHPRSGRASVHFSSKTKIQQISQKIQQTSQNALVIRFHSTKSFVCVWGREAARCNTVNLDHNNTMSNLTYWEPAQNISSLKELCSLMAKISLEGYVQFDGTYV